MNLRDLEYLVALEEERHFRKAAERCFVSQPTLSGQIQKLENELGVILIERTSRKVLFTPAGEAITRQARQALREIGEMKALAQGFAEPMSGEIHIGLIPTVGPYLLPHVIQDLREQFPRLEFFLYEDQTQVLLKRLEAGELDCLILAELEGMEGFGTIPLYQESMWLALPAGHPDAGQERVPFQVLKGKKLLMLADGHCLREQALGFCFAAGVGEDPRFKGTSLETLRNMVAAGSGMTLVPELAVPGRDEGGVSYRPVVDPVPGRTISLLYRHYSVRRPCFNELAARIAQLMANKMAG
ncbi:DNA-binding transcriptional regulator OxyR [Aeromonas schubertii]|uniref:Hydrogen peroxide-inducible genes activator n=1 Tax=Aeromonas schubertii TaxID=652 RepID=A0A0S2SDV8_9GAMM|nr:DNA-binding transcriptional regulator OxyR [Aeromonas schubertii]ALP39872.1 hydrogen peroxide-inducible genes activator [Aeromonas schubertii]MBZ6072543.1 DNA-binding transcriptional regulator OxyR [Aeromonas schubertii]